MTEKKKEEDGIKEKLDALRGMVDELKEAVEEERDAKINDIRVAEILKLCGGKCSNGFISLLDALECFCIDTFLEMDKAKGKDFMDQGREYWVYKMNKRFTELLRTIYDERVYEVIKKHKEEEERKMEEKRKENTSVDTDGTAYTINEVV